MPRRTERGVTENSSANERNTRQRVRISSSWGWRLGHLAVGPFACPLAHAMRERGGAMGRSETRAPLALIPSCSRHCL